MKRAFLFAVISAVLFPSCTTSDSLETGFRNPPAEARPMVWWHWMNGNITKEGIEKDLDWMQRTGIGGLQCFDITIGSQMSVMDSRIEYMSPEWKDNFRYAMDLAAEKGMTFGIAACPGWSQTGGPWVKPEQAMKKLCWSETDIQGGHNVTVALPQPPSKEGSFQNIHDPASSESFYRDIAVIGVRTPSEYSLPKPKVSSSGEHFSTDLLQDGDFSSSVELPYRKPGDRIWILYEYPSSQTICAADIAVREQGSIYEKTSYEELPVLEYSRDGREFVRITDVVKSGVSLSSVSFEPVEAKYFRLSMPTPEYTARDPRTMIWRAPSVKPTGVEVAEFKLWAMPRVNNFEVKAGFAVSPDMEVPTPEYSTFNMIGKEDVVDLSSAVSEDGVLTWEAPEGEWRILRFGYSLTGHRNGPAARSATGLEVDKMNEEYVRGFFDEYLGMMEDASEGRRIRSMVSDSWEAGCQNWTDSMLEDFVSLRGYDMTPWLPALAGYVIESSEKTDKFLYDFRKTLGDLVINNYYGVMSEIMEDRGMELYSESHESKRAFNGDGMEAKRGASVPMGAMWVTNFQEGTDIRESSSTAHIYGQKYIAAESLSTSSGNSWGDVPERLKPVADMELAAGLNRFVIHSSVHQPLDERLPGVTLGAFGQWFNRHDTWAENAAKPWMDYLARSSFMLQQGRNVADVLWFYGEELNITSCYRNNLPGIPDGYNFDFVNAEALMNALSVRNGKIVAMSGNEYSLICIDPVFARRMSLPVLRSIKSLIEAGAVVVGEKPEGSLGLEDDADEYAALVSELWKDGMNVRSIGKGLLLSGYSVSDALDYIDVQPDVIMSIDSFRFVHRSEGRKNWYWILNRSDSTENVLASFNIKGFVPEVWNAETGSIEPASYRMDEDRTIVMLQMKPCDAVFVVFRNRTKKTEMDSPVRMPADSAMISGEGWHVAFSGFDAPEDTVFSVLSDWSQDSNSCVKYYSGTAAYSRTFTVGKPLLDADEVWLDLGNVGSIAEVSINGHDAGLCWRAPFRFNVSGFLQEGENKLEVKVTNAWANRLIGDVRSGGRKFTWTSRNLYTEKSPLLPSGLIGPVMLVSCE